MGTIDLQIVRKYSIGSIFLFSVFLIFPIIYTSDAIAENDEVVIFSDRENVKQTDFFLLGEKSLSLRITFGNNCSNWRLRILDSPVLDSEIVDGTNSNINRGEVYYFPIKLNKTCIPGEYNLSINLTYKNQDNETVINIYDYPLECINAMSIESITLPTSSSKIFQIVINTNVTFDTFSLVFDGEGIIELSPISIFHENLESGLHTFSSNVTRNFNSSAGIQEVGWHLVAINGSRTIELGEKNIQVNVFDDTDNDDSNSEIDLNVILLVILISLLILYNYFRFKSK